MIEQQRSAGRRGGPEREAAAWLEKLAEVDRKRDAYQDQQAEGLITIDELRPKLAGLEEARKTAQRELETLRGHQEHIAELEADRDALLESHAELAPGALDSLTTEQRQKFYTLLRLEIRLAPDGSLQVRGFAFPEGLEVFVETTRHALLVQDHPGPPGKRSPAGAVQQNFHKTTSDNSYDSIILESRY